MRDDPTDVTEPQVPTTGPLWFALFTEIGIIGQLSRTLLENRLPEGLISAHFAVLNHLVRLGDGKTPLSIARAFQVPKTSMTHTLTVLEGRGLITLAPNPADGRSKLVHLTKAGRAVRQGAIDGLSPDIERLAKLYGIEKVAQIVPLLEELRQILDTNRPQQAIQKNE